MGLIFAGIKFDDIPIRILLRYNVNPIGIKNFKLADPIHNHNLFILAEKEIKRIENEKENISKFKPLIKLYDRADIINDIA